ncbi:Sucrose nonfermenting 4-like protein [Vitis vinifera]|uniref:Sucrose nonfermenting 4-like protein n=1 Tax=Vitis vinifera TaxID=29760 RepID=A0A438KLL3_VITVI|nr:Sucrose nonfermenting 4-like protein [Vitis vinifera]
MTPLWEENTRRAAGSIIEELLPEKLVILAQVSSIPIVDDNDSLLDIYSRSDITALAKNRVYAHINLDDMTIHQPAWPYDQMEMHDQENLSDFIRVFAKAGLYKSRFWWATPAPRMFIGVHLGVGKGGASIPCLIFSLMLLDKVALQLGQDPYSPYEFNSQRCQMCLRTDPLHEVMDRLANPGVRRLVIVEAGSRRVEGIVSLRDIFKFLLG